MNLKFKEISQLTQFLFPLDEPVIIKIIKVDPIHTLGGDNQFYTGYICNEQGEELEKISFTGNRFLNGILPHELGKYVRLTFRGYRDKDRKIGRDFKVEVQK